MARKKRLPADVKQAPESVSPSRGRRRVVAVAAVIAATLLAGAGVFFATRDAGRPDIILITIDTLRADAVGYSGNRSASTPFLDRLAAESIVFSQAHAHNVVTLPSHANILTGLLPYEHGIRDNAGFSLDARHETLATILTREGYATGAFVGAYPLDARFGLDRGFDVYDDKYREGSRPHSFEVAERTAAEVLSAARAWYDSVTGKPRFLWVHLYDPHAPYAPPEPFRSKFRQQPYLGEVASTDHELEAAIAPILEKNPNTVVVVTSDHGEALGDHGEQTHGLFAYEATLKVPMLLRAPDVSPRTEARTVWHIDIAPTLLQLAGVAIPPNLGGKSLLKVDAARDGYFEALSASLNRGWAPLVGMIRGRHKYIDLPIPELYDLASDPAESRNLVAAERRTVHALREELARRAPDQNSTRSAIGGEESSRLLSLGYIAGSAAKKAYTAADDPKNLVQIDAAMHRTVDLFQRGRIDEAVKVARDVVAKRPGMAAGEEMLAFLLQEAEESSAAIDVLEKAVAAGDASDSMKIRLGKALSENGRAAEAVALLEPHVHRDDPDLLNAYGIALADVGRLQEAKQQFDRVLRIDATNANAYQNLGVTALRMHDVAAARRYLARALELNDRLPLALNTMGVVEAQSGNADAALRLWGRAVTLDPRQYDALFNIALVAARAGRPAEARAALERFVATAPPERYGRDIEKAKALLRQLG